MKKIITTLLMVSCLLTAAYAAETDEYPWAKEAVDYCVEHEILHGMEDGSLALGETLTREQTAKLLVSTFLPDSVNEENTVTEFADIWQTRWSAPYIAVYQNYMKKKELVFNPQEEITREEFCAGLVMVSGLTEGNIRNRTILEENFSDADEVDKDYQRLLCIAVERGYMLGSEQKLNPKEKLTRVEACSLIYRVIQAKDGERLSLGVTPSETQMIGEPQVRIEQAKKWAEENNASENFVLAADFYWQYGELTGIRPEILYAQSAKETAFGRYGGRVLPEQNNFAGIKTKTATGDETYDHETFATQEDGVRGHFNHMSAYLGLEPIGEPHERYFSVSKMTWAGTIKTLEDLGGRWCPDLYYGYSILHHFITPMMETEV